MEYKGKKIYQEHPETADDYRFRYVEGIKSYISKMNFQCKEIRDTRMDFETLEKDRERYRRLFIEMIGLNKFYGKELKSAEIIYVDEDEICKIYRLVVYIKGEIPFYGMLLVPHGITEPIPLMITQHGGYGTPELCCDMHGKNNYNHIAQYALFNGFAVLAPQLLIWSEEEGETFRSHPISFNRAQIDIDMKRFGASVTGLEVAGIMQLIDLVSDMDNINSDQIYMQGISYGGYFTLYTMAADTRIKGGYIGAVFNDRDKYNWLDWTYHGSALMFQDAEVAALCIPRKLYIQVGKTDDVFDYNSAIFEMDRAFNYYKKCHNEKNICFSLWDGGHTVSNCEEIYKFLLAE